MSFKQRLITPIFVSRVHVENNAGDELEWVVNHTMSNIILQLSSLSRHAEDLFADLCRSTVDLNQRATNLGTKIKEIGERVSQLDATEEEVLFHNIHKCRHYKSTDQHDQQVVARITMSQAIQDLYNMCARPPPLDRLNMYRNDGKDCMKFYTDPAYFFELWLLAIQQDIEQKKEQKKKKGKARKHKRNVQVKVKDVTSIRERNKHKGMGAEFADDIRHKSIKTETHSSNQQEPMVNGDLPPPNDLDLLHPMSDEGTYPPPPPLMNQCYPDQDDLPPPPPPPLDESQSVPPPPPPPLLTSSGPQPPVAPPPPPPLHENGTPPPPPPPVAEMVKEPQKNQAVNKPDRSDLLSQIRAGNTQLKKMEDRKQQDKPKPPQDVHSMMTQLFVARRLAMEDTDSEGDDDDDDDDDEWDED